MSNCPAHSSLPYLSSTPQLYFPVDLCLSPEQRLRFSPDQFLKVVKIVSILVPSDPIAPPPLPLSPPGMAMVNMNSLLNGKDSRWLQLEVCREFQRNKCSRPDTECKFAHPPANVEVQNGRVTACYDSIKVRRF